MLRTRHAATALLAGALVLTGGGAFAAQKSAKDAAHDAAAAADITRVSVKNTEKKLIVHTKLRKASAGRSHVVATLTPATEGAAPYVARTVETGPGKKVGATLETTAADATEPTAVDCAGIKASVSSGRSGQVVIRIPQACFGDDAGTFTVEVVTETASGDVADEVPTTLKVKQG
jgi:cytoskeletal protein RodZ